MNKSYIFFAMLCITHTALLATAAPQTQDPTEADLISQLKNDACAILNSANSPNSTNYQDCLIKAGEAIETSQVKSKLKDIFDLRKKLNELNSDIDKLNAELNALDGINNKLFPSITGFGVRGAFIPTPVSSYILDYNINISGISAEYNEYLPKEIKNDINNLINFHDSAKSIHESAVEAHNELRSTYMWVFQNSNDYIDNTLLPRLDKLCNLKNRIESHRNTNIDPQQIKIIKENLQNNIANEKGLIQSKLKKKKGEKNRITQQIVLATGQAVSELRKAIQSLDNLKTGKVLIQAVVKSAITAGNPQEKTNPVKTPGKPKPVAVKSAITPGGTPGNTLGANQPVAVTETITPGKPQEKITPEGNTVNPLGANQPVAVTEIITPEENRGNTQETNTPGETPSPLVVTDGGTPGKPLEANQQAAVNAENNQLQIQSSSKKINLPVKGNYKEDLKENSYQDDLIEEDTEQGSDNESERDSNASSNALYQADQDDFKSSLSDLD